MPKKDSPSLLIRFDTEAERDSAKAEAGRRGLSWNEYARRRVVPPTERSSPPVKGPPAAKRDVDYRPKSSWK